MDSRIGLVYVRLVSQVALLLIASSLVHAAKTVYVDVSGGNDSFNGLSWTTAKKSVTAGISLASSGDQVWVAQGTYIERITLKNGVSLYGGFPAGGNWSSRDVAAHEAVLDGSQGGSVVTVPSGVSSATRLDGFTIMNGSAQYGGGINCDTSALAITGNVIRDNFATLYGGGIYVKAGSPVITGNTILRNGSSRSDFRGGGIACCLGGAPTISDNRIADNLHEGVYTSASASLISHNTFTGNASAGVYCLDGPSDVSANTFIGNGGGVSSGSDSTIVRNNVIRGSLGCGISCTRAGTVVTGNLITNGRGSGIICNAAVTASNNTVISNAGYGISFSNAAAQITNNIVAFNSCGMYVGYGPGTPVLVRNCVYGNTGGDYVYLSPGTTDLSVDPRLAGYQYGRYHIRADSPCVDYGDNSVVHPGSVDMDGQPRVSPSGGRVDIGADESYGETEVYVPIIVRVSPTGDDRNDGSHWDSAHAMGTVQAAIDVVAPHGGEVWVKAGTYPTCVTLPAYVHLYGGFAGTETVLSQRDSRANTTVLDGQQDGSVVTALDGYRISTIDGFTIRNGSALHGGGVSCSYSSPTISNNVITGNSSSLHGAGIWASYSSLLIRDNELVGNHASQTDWAGGGGVGCENGYPEIRNNLISENSSRTGGGVYCDDYCNATISGNTIARNAANYGGGGVRIGRSSVLEGNTITGNSGDTYGGGVTSWSGDVIIRNNTITSNSAIHGAGVFIAYTSQVITGNIIARNSGFMGHEVDCYYSARPVITNNTVIGGSIGSTGLPVGTGIYCESCAPVISNNIIAYLACAVTRYDTKIPTVRYNCLHNPGGRDYSGVSLGQGDISVDPLLLNWQGGDYHLTATSPCINSGLNTASNIPEEDIDGQPRVRATTIDIGADESWPASTLLDARLSGNNMPAEISSVVVTAAFTDHFYVETESRVVGIRVNKPNHGFGIGSKVNVSGVLQTDSNGERMISTATVVPAGTGSVDPIGMNIRSLGGSSWLFSEATGAGQKGIAGASGLNNIGMLVRIYGRFSYIDAHRFTVQDGSGAAVECITPDGVIIQPNWTYVSVTGISSCKQGTAGLEPLVKVRIQEDIVPL